MGSSVGRYGCCVRPHPPSPDALGNAQGLMSLGPCVSQPPPTKQSPLSLAQSSPFETPKYTSSSAHTRGILLPHHRENKARCCVRFIPTQPARQALQVHIYGAGWPDSKFSSGFEIFIQTIQSFHPV